MSEPIERSLGRVEGQLISFNEKLETLLAMHKASDERHEKHRIATDQRLTRLEKWQAKLIGAYAALVVIVGLVLKVFT